MATIDFPNAPAVNDLFTVGSIEYRWTGVAWVSSTIATIAWASVTGKPTEFAPSAHATSHGFGGADAVTIEPSQVTGLNTFIGDVQAALPSKQDIVAGVSSTEIGYLGGVTSAIQTQINSKAPTASPTFTGTVTTPLTAGFVKSSAGGVLSANGIVTADVTGLDTALAAKASLTGTETLTNKTLTAPVFGGGTRETIYRPAVSFNSTYNFDVNSNGLVQWPTGNATSSNTINFRGSSTVQMNDFLATNNSVTAVFLVNNASVGYYPNAITIDGSAQAVKWVGGTAPTAGNANSVDIYTYTIVKTNTYAYTVFGSFAKFA